MRDSLKKNDISTINEKVNCHIIYTCIIYDKSRMSQIINCQFAIDFLINSRDFSFSPLK